MDEAQRAWALEHLLAFETADDVAAHLLSDHGYGGFRDTDQRELDVVHLREHRRLADSRPHEAES